MLRDATVAAGAIIESFSHIESAAVGAAAHVGPFARLRPGAVLEEDTRVGNFVELKKTRLKKGAKANHLSYLGDAVIGREEQHRSGYDHVQFRWRPRETRD